MKSNIERRNILSAAFVEDSINVQHIIKFCKPVPTDNYVCDSGVPPNTTDCNIFTRNLQDFPLDNLPASGSCTPGNIVRISPSEMFLVFLQLNNLPSLGQAKIFWFNKNPARIMSQYTYNITSLSNWWTWSMVGHFTPEIKSAGDYQCYISTPFGVARIDFFVTEGAVQCPTDLAVSVNIPS